MPENLKLKIAIIGCNGQLGSDLCHVLSNHEIIPLNHNNIEIIDDKQTFSTLEQIKPQIVLNTAAFHNVPKCETHTKQAMSVNIGGPANLAKACSRLKIQLVHFSTDYVFNGEKNTPYLEEDNADPLNFYGLTKRSGEQVIPIYHDNYKIVRISGIYGKTPCRAKGSNFVLTMLKLAKEKKELKVVSDETANPTYTVDIANQISQLVLRPDTGIFHISNAGQCSWFEFTKAIFNLTNNPIPIIPIQAAQFPSSVKRPRYTVLENKRTKDLDIYNMRHWKDSLKEYIQTLAL